MKVDERLLPTWIDRDLYPFPVQSFDLREGAMSYVDEGSGPTVLLVHGTPGWTFEFRELIRDLSSTCRVVAPDHLGFGLSERIPGGDYTVRGHADRLAGFINGLTLSDIHLVVHDFGGPIGIGAALQHLGRVKSITVMNTWMWPLNGIPMYDQTTRYTGWLGRTLYHRFNFSAKVLVPKAFSSKDKLKPEVHRHYIRAQDRLAREAAFTFAQEILAAKPYLDDVWQQRGVLTDRVKSVIWGMADEFVPAEIFLPQWREAFPAAEVVEMAGVGHYPHEEEPSLVADVIRRGVLGMS